jgi:hypothetical protein
MQGNLSAHKINHKKIDTLFLNFYNKNNNKAVNKEVNSIENSKQVVTIQCLSKRGNNMATKKTTANPEFLYISVDKIVVLEQVRSSIDIEKDSFKSLVQSIKDKGILEPLILTAQDDGTYLLICGERRLLAAKQMGLESVPVRIIEAGRELGDTIALQLTENLQREDLNPIDQAKGILSYIQSKHPDLSASSEAQAGKGYDVGGIMSGLVSYKLKPDDPSNPLTPTVGVIIKITGKSITTMFNTISLLKLVPKIQVAIISGKLPVSQGYLFAANLGSPDFFTIFDEIMVKPVTNAKLERMLTEYKKAKHLPSPGGGTSCAFDGR